MVMSSQQRTLYCRQRSIIGLAADPATLGYLLHVWISAVIKVREGIGLFEVALHIFLGVALGPDQLMGTTSCPHLDHAAEYIIKPV